MTLGEQLQVGEVRTLFPLGDLRTVAVSRDGSRFLATRVPPVKPATEIVVVRPWFEELERRVPSK